MSLLSTLNEQQREAVTTIDSHVRIIAGAGSGKTRVITTRIAYLLESCGVYAHRILAITFTNKAANEMKERVRAILGDASAGIQISTIHSFCVRLLREDIYELAYPRNFTIVDSDDQKAILREAYRELDVDVKTYSFNSVLGYISQNKTHLVDPDQAKDFAKDWRGEQIKAEVYAYYQRRLKAMYALDFDDLLLFTYQLLKDNEEVRRKWQRRFQFIHVDEFQDVDELQYAIIRYLVGDHSWLCVVGDPDQTIYTWRGAQVDIIMNFERDFPDCKTIVLNENYRSTPSILAGANSLIKNNKNRIDKDLFTRKDDTGKIIHFSAIDEQNEPVWVSARIRALHVSGISYRDIAVLYRSNYLSRSLERTLLDAQIPYRIYGGIRFYDRAEIKDSLSYLRLLLDDNPAQDLAVKRVINAPKRGIGAKTMELIEQGAKAHQSTLYAFLKEGPIARGKAQTSIDEFVRVIEDCRAQREALSISRLLEKVIQDSGYLFSLEQDKETERIENIKELINDIDLFEQNNPEGTLDEYLQMISLYTDKEQENTGEFVQLMTVHAAKGLEFNHVFVYSLCEGIFPSEKSISEGGEKALEEERRLAYVAFTRAREHLYLSDSQGYSFVLDRVKRTSRFVREIDENYLEDVGLPPKATARSYGYREEETPFSSQMHQPMPDYMPDEASIRPAKKRGGPIRKGDHVVHIAFGEGIVINVKEGLAQIAFDRKYGIRKIMADHPSLAKK